MPVKEVLSLGAGLQSSVLLLMSCRGELPRLDAAVFADTKAEPTPVYEHLAWLKGEAARAGIPVYEVSAGDLRADSLEFRQNRTSSDGKRQASVPFFVKNPDGTQGKINRQCTKEYKVQPVEMCVRRDILGLKPRQRAPRTVVVNQWMGITTDEARRAKPPGVFKERKKAVATLLGEQEVRVKEWHPLRWKTHTFPFLNLTLWPDRRNTNPRYVEPSHGWDRKRCREWAEANYPDRVFPRSACTFCPFRSDAEWLWLKENDPTGWADAVAFDLELRERDAAGIKLRTATGKRRIALVGEPYVHRQMVPLGLVDFEAGKGGWMGESKSCGVADDACEGLCGA